MADDHYLPFFVGDFMASTATWTGPERGLYMQMLAVEWTSGPLPCDPHRLARALCYEWSEFEPLWPTVKAKFDNGDGKLRNGRLEAIRSQNAELQIKRRQRAQLAAYAMHAKRTAPEVPQACSEHAPSTASSTASSSAPSMPSDPIRSDPIRSDSESEGERARAARPKSPPRKRCPEDFVITEALRRWAAEKTPDVSLDSATEKFRDWEFARSRTDWAATWRNWMRGEQEKARPKPLEEKRNGLEFAN